MGDFFWFVSIQLAENRPYGWSSPDNLSSLPDDHANQPKNRIGHGSTTEQISLWQPANAAHQVPQTVDDATDSRDAVPLLAALLPYQRFLRCDWDHSSGGETWSRQWTQ